MNINIAEAHQYFSASLFNSTWVLIDKSERTADEQEQMLLRAMSSYYHWTQRSDVDSSKRSIGCWQISRVYAVLDNGMEAQRWARRAIDEAEHSADPFLLAYGFEALGRAASLIGDEQLAASSVVVAMELANSIQDASQRAALMADLETISFGIPED